MRMKSNRREFMARLAGALLGTSLLGTRGGAFAGNEGGGRPPNIVFLFADDLGWGDLGCYGHRRLKTPSLDRLADEGILFTQFYVSGSVCSPSRAAIMTGQCPARLGIHGHFAAPENNERRGMPDYLDPEVPTFTRLLQERGYAVGQFGKWHLGSGPGAPLPSAYGIDEHRTNTSNDPDAGGAFNLWSPELRPVASKMVLDEAIQFIERHRDGPFYVNAWFVDPHATLNPSEEQMAPYERFSPRGVDFRGAEQVYYATVTEMDRQIGIFLQKLDELGLRENTIVIFSSDNGPEDIHISNASHSGVGSPGPLRGRKRSLYEGGVRVPFIVRWPGRAPAGRVDNDSVIAGVDFLPTLCALAGAEIPEGILLDGEDRSAAFRGETTRRERPLYWEWRYRVFGHPFNRCPMLAMRDGDWKLLMNPDRSRVELYNIVEDPREMDNRASEHPDIVDRMAARLLAWQGELPESPLDEDAGSDAYPWPE